MHVDGRRMSGAERWFPSTYPELRDAIEGGRLGESHYRELKRELPTTRKLAEEMAALAIDGGSLIIGVDENAASLTPVPLGGLRELVSQVARDAIDEPLFVQPYEIRQRPTSTEGFMVVEVPESPQAPHRVKGRYYARSGTTIHPMPYPEVERLIARRSHDEKAVGELLEAEIARDPVPDEVRQRTHLYTIARPVSQREDMLRKALGDQTQNWVRVLRSKLFAGKAQEPFHVATDLAPDIARAAATQSSRAGGWAFHSYGIGPGRRMHPEAGESTLLDLEVGHDGLLRLFCGYGSRAVGEDGIQVVMESTILGLTKRLLLIAGNVAEVCAFRGSWDLGVSVAPLRGRISFRLHTSHGGLRGVPYSEDDYTQTVRATWDELTQDTDGVVRRLLLRLNLSLNEGVAPIPALHSEYAARPRTVHEMAERGAAGVLLPAVRPSSVGPTRRR